MTSSDITDNLTTDPLATTDTTSTGSTDPVPPAISLDQADADYVPGETVGITTNVPDGGTFTFQVAHLSAGADGVLGTADDVLSYDLTGTGTPWTVTDGGSGDLDGVVNGSIQTSWYVNADAAGQAFVLTATDQASGQIATANFTDAPLVNAPTYDLTYKNTVTINNAIFSSSDVVTGAGTGLLDPFVRIQATGSEQGYNTDSNATKEPTSQYNFILDNTAKGGSNYVHSLNIADIPIQFINGVGYYRFDLDINESNTASVQNLSLDALQIWQATAGDLHNYVSGAHPDQGTGVLPNATQVYNLDDGGDKFIGLNGELQPGSGNTTDMSFLVPVSNFDPNKPYIYLYSAFGYQLGTYQGPTESTPSTWTSESGFEEWNRQIGQVIDGHKFDDLNADHIWEAGEPALAGWTIYLDANNNNQLDPGEPFAVTDANGYYKFTVTPGTYTIREVPQDGWSQDAPNNAQGEFTVTVAAGQDSHNNDFGNFQLGSISGHKYVDADGKLSTPGDETPVSGWTISLYNDANHNNTADAGELVATTTTDGNGVYQFKNLLPGDYLIQEEDRTGWTHLTSATINQNSLTSGQNLTNQDFVNVQLGSISGHKYVDADGNLLTTGDESPVSGWTISLYNDANHNNTADAGELVATTTTDGNGVYQFKNLLPGDYLIQEEDRTGWTHLTSATINQNSLTSGQNLTNQDFVNVQLGSISGHKYVDADGNLATTGDETAVSGWTISLYNDANHNNTADAGELVATTTTDGNGVYQFKNLLPGDYLIQEEDRTGWTHLTSATINQNSLTSGQNLTNQDFVNVQLGSISGHKYVDADGNLATTGDETAVSGWTISLYNDANHNNTADAGELVATTTTDGNGVYQFKNLLPGDYLIQEEDRTGWTHLTSATINQNSLTSGQNLTNQDFVNVQLGSISGHKYVDADGNLATTGDETAVSGWTISLYNDANHNNTADAGELVATTTTDGNGVYQFKNLLPGDYLIQEEDRTGWTHLTSATINQNSLTSGQNLTNQDFVNVQLGSISGHKYVDADGNLLTTGDESPVSGWTISLYNDANHNNTADAGELVATTTTDGNGVYQFKNLLPGDYLIQEEDRTGWTHLTSATINQNSLTSGQNLTNQDFVNVQLGSISGHKYVDADGNLATTGDETAVSGWTISLYNDANHNNTADAGELVATTTTDGNGVYQFKNLLPGDYLIQEEDRTGWTHLTSATINQNSLTSGQNLTNQDFVNFKLFEISGTKYLDANGDGQTTGDSGLDGITIFIDKNKNGVYDAGTDLSTVTHDGGKWSFTGLDYTYAGLKVYEYLPAGSGYIQSLGQAGYTITGTSGANQDNLDFANFVPGSIHGFKFNDMDANGKYDGSDVPMAGITIQLVGDVDGNGTIDTLTTTTDASGYFSFGNLHPGTYTVSELFTDGTTWGATVDHNNDGIGDATTTVTVLSGQELVAVAGEEGQLDPLHTEVNVGNALTFGNHELGALGLTPGFWYNHEYVWDAPILGTDNSNGGVDGKGVSLASKLAAAGTISDPDIAKNLPGNLDVDGDNHNDLVFQGSGGKTLVIEWDDAREIVGGANGTGGDKLGDFVRYAITTLLNEAGVPNFSAPAGMNANIADWLIKYAPTTVVNGVNVLNYNNHNEPGTDGFLDKNKVVTVKASSAAWQSGSGGLPSGAQIFADMNATTDGATGNNMMLSLNQSHVFTTQDEGDHFGIVASALNYSGSYLQLHV
ncbi:SdrD B-like domain-containing protein [Mesorhizobium sp. J8]|uniref:SdrD B-like domain-containing protein n=1 Tax=Mesorhizobium sp. J8 TaxID=2777475 RepID=UPI0019168579|nr:SdrD B-like domain-containing protein [Mesorhizobium sp. J8]BCM19021.1 serine-aspartate repeat-containing protein D [Mesorhizobium sp. J8]